MQKDQQKIRRRTFFEKIGRAREDLKSMLIKKFGNKASKLKTREEKRQFNKWKESCTKDQWRRWEANEQEANTMSEL